MTGYLFAFTAVITLLVGALLQAMISYLTNARWFAVLRRYAWMLVSGLWGAALLVIPIVLAMRVLYPWTRPGVRHSPWLQAPWFVIRSAIFLGAWIWFAERISARRNARIDPMRRESPPRSASCAGSAPAARWPSGSPSRLPDSTG